MSSPQATNAAACAHCHRSQLELLQSPFTAELLCLECLRHESAELSRLRNLRTGHHIIACDTAAAQSREAPQQGSAARHH